MIPDRSAAGVPAAGGVRPQQAWQAAAAPLAIGLLAIGIAYAAEFAAAVRIWAASTAFNHCFLILPMAGYLLYARWDAVVAAEPRPAPLIAAAAVPVGAAWFVAERAGIMEGRQLLAVVLVQILVMATLGLRTWRVLAAPLLYLFFLVPVGEYAIPWLQSFTVGFIDFGLGVLGIPHFIDGIAIQIPAGQFLVAEACAGLRFVIASAAFGVFYACLVYASPLRRLLFIAASLVVPVVANGFRALAIVVIGNELGSARAAAVDHLVYGWVFFAASVSLLIIIGLSFREHGTPSAPRAAAPDRAAAPAGAAAAIAVVAVALSVAVPRAAADYLDRNAAAGFVTRPAALAAPSGCTSADLPAAMPPRPDSGSAEFARNYDCGGDRLTLRLFVFPARTAAGPIFATLRGASIARGWDEIAAGQVTVGEGNAAHRWVVTTLGRHGQFRAAAAALWIDGSPRAAGVASRLRQALAVLRRGDAPVLVATVLTAPQPTPDAGRAALAGFLGAAGGMADAAARPPAPARRQATRR